MLLVFDLNYTGKLFFTVMSFSLCHVYQFSVHCLAQ
jgi:hypothetical protein